MIGQFRTAHGGAVSGELVGVTHDKAILLTKAGMRVYVPADCLDPNLNPGGRKWTNPGFKRTRDKAARTDGPVKATQKPAKPVKAVRAPLGKREVIQSDTVKHRAVLPSIGVATKDK